MATTPTGGQAAAYDVVMFTFDGVDTAAAKHRKLKEEGSLDGCEIEGEALVSRNAAGQVHFHERGAAATGATLGAVTATIVGVVGGPVLFLLFLAAGGVLGGLVGHLAGRLLPAEDLRRVGESLQPGTSAYLALVDAAHADAISEAFAAEGAEVLNIPVETELASVVREGITHQVTRVPAASRQPA